MTMTVSAELITKVKKAAYLEGQFTTRAGKQTDYYIDKFLFETKPDILALIAKEFVPLLPPLSEFDRLVAPALGAVSLGAALSVEIQKPFVIVKKKTDETDDSQLLVGDYIPGERVVVLEDVLSSGMTVLAAIDLLEMIPLSIQKVVSVINREEGAFASIQERGYSCASLMTSSDLKESKVT